MPFTVSYDGNGSDSGAVPSDLHGPYNPRRNRTDPDSHAHVSEQDGCRVRLLERRAGRERDYPRMAGGYLVCDARIERRALRPVVRHSRPERRRPHRTLCSCAKAACTRRCTRSSSRAARSKWRCPDGDIMADGTIRHQQTQPA